MAATAPTQRRAAEIVVTGVGLGDVTASRFLRAELEGVRYVPFARYDAPALDEAFRDADMLVIIAGANEPVNATRTQAVADAARERGMMVAAMVVEAGIAGGSPMLAVVRDAADMVVIVRDPAALTQIVSALR